MRELSQAVWGMLAALLSTILVLGGLMMSLAEGGMQAVAIAEQSPTLTMTLPTQRPGEPTYTPSPSPLPTSTPTAMISNVCSYPDGWAEVFVDFGDDFFSLASRYGISVEQLRESNCLDMRALMPGMTVYVPPLPTATAVPPSHTPALPALQPTPTYRYCPRPYGWVIYYVKRGDTLSSISSARGITYQVLMDRNCLTSTIIRPGQRLYVPNVPVVPASVTPAPVISPTSPPPPATWTSIPPTAVIPSATNSPSTSTPIPTTSTPVSLPTDTSMPPTWTATTTQTVPAPSVTPTLTPTTPVPLPATPKPSDTATIPPLPSATSTSTPLAIDTQTSQTTAATEADR